MSTAQQSRPAPNYDVIDAGGGKFIKAWKRGVLFDDKTIEQLKATAHLPFVFKWVAAMPDAHWGLGSTVGSVIPTQGAICPAAVGVDIGCGMFAVQTTAAKSDLDFAQARKSIERVVPHGRTHRGGRGDRGAWGNVPAPVQDIWDAEFEAAYEDICARDPHARAMNTTNHLGTLGTGNHFIELAEDEAGKVWVVIHSGSRGLGNKIGGYFTERAHELCARWFIHLPNKDLAYLPKDTDEFKSYWRAVDFAQKFAWQNRLVMMESILKAVGLERTGEQVHSHHNYVAWENHFGQNVMVTRKGAVRARAGDMGIIPGSMGARTYIVEGLGSEDSFCSCSHGAGRAMSRGEAIRRFTLADHAHATEGVECLKDESVLDETPGAYKDIETVMAAQTDLVRPVHVLKQFVCVKGGKE